MSSRQFCCKFGSKSYLRLHALKPMPVSLLQAFKQLSLCLDKLFKALLPKLCGKQTWGNFSNSLDVGFLLGHDAVSIRSPPTHMTLYFLPSRRGRQVKRQRQPQMEPLR